MRSVFVLMALTTFISPAMAWNNRGHKTVAAIAFRQLTEAEQQKVCEVLRNHPRFNKDFLSRIPDEMESADIKDQNEWIFQQAAIWPDLVKSLPVGIKAQYHQAKWHYVNRPHFLTDEDQQSLEPGIAVNLVLTAPATPEPDMNIIQTIRFARNALSTSNTAAEDRALYLCWLFHLVGDVHQPLHSAALYSQRVFPNGDRGGNGIRTVQSDNLHAVWDGLLGRTDKFQSVSANAIGLQNEFSESGTEAGQSLDEAVWLDESFSTATDHAYADEVLAHLHAMEEDPGDFEFEKLDLSEEYLQTAGEIARKRVVQAGFRLGAILKMTAQ